MRVVDIDAARVARLREGIVPIHEPGLDELIAEGLANGRLSFHAEQSGTHGSTARHRGGRHARSGWRVDRGDWSSRRSPCSPLTRGAATPGGAQHAHAGHGRRAGADGPVDRPAVRLCFNPEFTREATAVRDFLEPDRVVVGAGRDAEALVDELHELYAPMEKPILDTDLTSAETIKIASNVFLAAKISFANELARLCAATGADVHARPPAHQREWLRTARPVHRLAHADHRHPLPLPDRAAHVGEEP